MEDNAESGTFASAFENETVGQRSGEKRGDSRSHFNSTEKNLEKKFRKSLVDKKKGFTFAPAKQNDNPLKSWGTEERSLRKWR